MFKPYRIYFQQEDKIFYLDETKNILEEQTIKQRIENNSYYYYEMFSDYKNTLESAIEYKNNFDIWCDELKNHNIYYKKYFHHNSAVMLTFKRYSTNQLKSLQFDAISYDEFKFMEGCNNGGLVYFDKQYSNKSILSFGKDYSSFYPSNLSNSDLQIPIKEGVKFKLKKLKFKKLEYGIYNVKILCDNEDFSKIFSFSKNNFYTHYSLKFAYEHRKQFNITFELNVDVDFNALIYEEEYLINSSYLFSNWYNNLIKLKSLYPKNKLIKHLLSSVWGSLCQYNKIHLNEDEFNKLSDDSISDWNDKLETKYKILQEKVHYDKNDEQIINYTLVETDKAYKNTLARIKPFLISFSRNMVGSLISKKDLFSNVIRIHTDGIVFNKDFDFSDLEYYPKTEIKTSGLIHWTSLNKYSSI